ncbi:MAG: dihydrofolate reductase [Clostridia bacterium]|nr:dihydrofolate reductase [Clostridia bacterium]
MIEIVNVSSNWAIGKKGQLLLHLPPDMQYFRETTRGKTCIMGSTTLESFPHMAPLKDRKNIVLIDDEKKIRPESLAAAAADKAAGRTTELVYVPSLQAALDAVKDTPKDEVFVIGGASIYRLFLPYCDTCLVTHNDYPSEGADTFYPDLLSSGEWKLSYEGEEQAYEGVTYRFCRYERLQ